MERHELVFWLHKSYVADELPILNYPKHTPPNSVGKNNEHVTEPTAMVAIRFGSDDLVMTILTVKADGDPYAIFRCKRPIQSLCDRHMSLCR